MSVLILAPIIAESPDDHTHLDALKLLLYGENWYDIRKKHLEELSMLHMARFQIIEHLVPAMGDEDMADELLTKFVLFVAEIDGRSDAFFDQLYREDPQSTQIGTPEPHNAGSFVRKIWGHCVGFPNVEKMSIYRFRQYMQQHEIKTMLYYPAIPNSRDEILRALCVKQLTAAWVSYQSETVSNAGPKAVQRLEDYLRAVQVINELQRVDVVGLYAFMFEPVGLGSPPLKLSFNHILNQLARI